MSSLITNHKLSNITLVTTNDAHTLNRKLTGSNLHTNEILAGAAKPGKPVQQTFNNNKKYTTSLTQKLKDSGRATIILIVVSTFFVLLNLPYIVAWTVFYIPLKRGILTDDDEIHFRYSFVYLSEVFHVSNFCINFFLYYAASKIFRNRFMYKFSVLKKLHFRACFCREE
jgi:hypothetical protein